MIILIKKNLSIFTDILLLFLILVLIFNIFSIFNSKKMWKDETVQLFGYKLYIDGSNSMSPTINKGDLIVAKIEKIENLNVGDIVVFYDVAHDISITHRISNILHEDGNTMLETKGDNNNLQDLQLVSEDNLEAKYLFRFKGLGDFLMFFKTVTGFIVLCLIIVVFILVSILISFSFNKKEAC